MYIKNTHWQNIAFTVKCFLYVKNDLQIRTDVVDTERKTFYVHLNFLYMYVYLIYIFNIYICVFVTSSTML